MLSSLCSPTGLNRQEAFSRVGFVPYLFEKQQHQKKTIEAERERERERINDMKKKRRAIERQ